MLAWSELPVRVRTVKARPIDPFDFSEFIARGIRKVTTGITGLWRPSVLSDVAFWSFDVGSSYHWVANGLKCWFVHPYRGTWAGFRPLRNRLVLPYCGLRDNLASSKSPDVKLRKLWPVREERHNRTTGPRVRWKSIALRLRSIAQKGWTPLNPEAIPVHELCYSCSRIPQASVGSNLVRLVSLVRV